jgi:enoyl-CoA hydratase/carnithine racemase
MSSPAVRYHAAPRSGAAGEAGDEAGGAGEAGDGAGQGDADASGAAPGHVGVITLDRPDNRNSMTPELLTAFSAAVAAARADRDARCIVITGTGSCFSAGADFRSMVQLEAAGPLPHQRSFAMYEPFLSVLELEVPVIAALNGHAVGGGFGLSLMCDLRVAALEGRYGANFVRLGLHPGMAITYLLPRLVGVATAAELLFTGRLVEGEEARRIGLASRAVPAAEVLPVAMQLAEAIAANAPLAVRLTKRSLRRGLQWDPRDAALHEALVQAETLETEDAARGIDALLRKQTPRFTGK